MDNQVILAVAGSGKTSKIKDSLQSSGRTLVVTYTENNYKNLYKQIADEYGFIPERIRLYTYFSFLYSFCLRPFLGDELKVRGINWDIPKYKQKIAKTNPCYYLDKGQRLYYNRMASLLSEKHLLPDLKRRLSRYFDSFFVDEIQDFSGHDFNFLFDLSLADVSTVMVGDFYQHTYDTSRDGNVNKNLHKSLTTYTKRLKGKGYNLDHKSLSKSYRCSLTICSFISQKMGIEIESHREDETKFEYVDSQLRADQLFKQDDIVKLFHNSHKKYSCFSDNWGASKGIDSYGSVCVVLNKKTDDFYKNDKLTSLPAITKNKLYVACTRSRADLYLVPEKYYKKYKN